MTQESLIPKVDDQSTEKKPDEMNQADPTTNVEGNTETSLISPTDTSNQSNVDWEKRYKDLQSFQSRRENDLRTKIQELEAADSSFVAPTTEAEMEAFKEKHLDIYNMMLTLANQQATEATQGISTQLQTFEQEKMMSDQAKAKAKIQQAHPDYVEVVSTQEFQAWAQEQPPTVQQWIYENPDDPDLAIIALDRYKAQRDANKAHLEKEAADKAAADKAQADAAKAVSAGSPAPSGGGDGPKIWTASEIKRMTSAQFKEHEQEIDAAYLEGRVNFNS